MKLKIVWAVIATFAGVAFLIVNQLTSADTPSAVESPKPVYSVSNYDPKRDPVTDLAATVAIAEKDGRRILLLIGGNW